MHSNKVRQTFIDYFARNGHRALPSSSLIPYGDNTILFTNAGMNQFKNAFLGLEKRDYVRAVTSQKVMRVSGKHNDLENVGPSKRHHTFFEMLGNFSLGDYFKDDAMTFALELLEGEYGFERERLWFTVYKDDDEAITLWQKHGISADRILRFGEKDNFWSMGPTGPCGPNSEIHYYTGDKKDNNLAKWVNSDEDLNETTVEIWNLVFMQFNRTEDQKLHPLPQTGVDTGMGFERLVRLLQKGENNYETDLFEGILEHTQQLAGHTRAQRMANIIPYRVIADHVRAASFLIGDGVLPGNDGRNYVLRMVMRRAMRFGRKLGLEQPFLYQVAESVIDNMGQHYAELVANKSRIQNTIHREEERFQRALDQGLGQLDTLLSKSSHISGEDAFKLYDTLGLPFEITRDEAVERGGTVDEAGYQAARAESRARNKGTGAFAADFGKLDSYRDALADLTADGTLPPGGLAYHPYGPGQLQTSVLAMLLEGEPVDRAVPGQTYDVILADTPLYIESGGQTGDTGTLTGEGWSMVIKAARRPMPGLIVHHAEVTLGEPLAGAVCTINVDHSRRAEIQRNHTATHLLQKALRTVVGAHVGQQGSLVDEHRLRFDFSQDSALTQEQLDGVLGMLNQSILDNLPVVDAQMAYKDAIASGAMAFFSEKYGDTVRVVSIGGDYSRELCGGTHVARTGDIGAAVLIGESAVSAGVRRIEILTGSGALAHIRAQQQQLRAIAQAVGAGSEDLAGAVARQAEQLRDTQKQLEQARRELARQRFERVAAQASTVNNTPVLIAQVEADSNDQMREMSDWYRERARDGVAVLGAVIADKPALLVSVPAELNKRGVNAGALIKDIAAVVGGGGGGRPNLAQAGGKDPAKLGEALSKARELLEKALA
jgi:alanyl-tRNA synthetase